MSPISHPPDPDPAHSPTPDPPEAATWNRRACFRFLSLMWVFPDLGALAILLTSEMDWIHAPNWGRLWEQVAIEQWVALGILLAHGWFLRQATRPDTHETDGPSRTDARSH